MNQLKGQTTKIKNELIDLTKRHQALEETMESEITKLKAKLELQNAIKNEDLALKPSNVDCLTERPPKIPIPPAPLMKSIPAPPPIPGLAIPPPPPFFKLGSFSLKKSSDVSISVKKKITSKHKLPSLNWTPLNPNQIRGTIFIKMQDDLLINSIDFEDFEEKFKLNNDLNYQVNLPATAKCFKKPELLSLLDAGRLRNVSIVLKKIQMDVDEVTLAINDFNLSKLSLENVELLLKAVPNQLEIKQYKNYVKENRDVDLLSLVDRYLMKLTKIENLESKLEIMCVTGNFAERSNLLHSQLTKISTASVSIKYFYIFLFFQQHI